jgi:hypothetical protein
MCLVCTNSYHGKKTVNCSRCPDIEIIPELEGVTTIMCSFCPKLKEIFPAPSLNVLICNNCDNLSVIHPSFFLTELTCKNCVSLEDFYFPSLRKFDGKGSSVRKISGNPRDIDISKTMVKSVDTNFVSLRCNDCPVLEKIVIPKNSEIFADKCPLLTKLPENTRKNFKRSYTWAFPEKRDLETIVKFQRLFKTKNQKRKMFIEKNVNMYSVIQEIFDKY